MIAFIINKSKDISVLKTNWTENYEFV